MNNTTIVKMDVVKSDIEKAIRQECRKLNHTLVYVSKLSHHPSDNYLYFVVARYANTDSYTTWIANSSNPNGTVSLGTGHYGLRFNRALEIWANNIR